MLLHHCFLSEEVYFLKEVMMIFLCIVPYLKLITLMTIHLNFILHCLLKTDDTDDDPPQLHPSLPQWMWAQNVAIYSNHLKVNESDNERPPWGWTDEGTQSSDSSSSCSKFISLLELPLAVPRWLTIPSVEEEMWSKPFAVASAVLAPVLLAFLWSSLDNVSSQSRLIAYLICVSIGCVLGVLAYRSTTSDRPPQKFLIVWVLGGFFMSIIWFYMIANELVALLVAFGMIFGINPSILGLTVLAWGNSMGDLVSNVGISNERWGRCADSLLWMLCRSHVQHTYRLRPIVAARSLVKETISISGSKGQQFVFTMGFLMSGLIYALVVLPRNDMRPNKLLGIGLIALYVIFLSLRVSVATGLISV